jgi:transposase-like protein
MSLRYAAKSLRSVIVRSYTSIWRWVQRLGPVLGSFGADPRDVHRIFVDETMVNAGGTSALIWIAFEPDLRAMLDFHVSWRGNLIDAYLFIWLSAFMFIRNFVFENGDLEGMEAPA